MDILNIIKNLDMTIVAIVIVNIVLIIAIIGVIKKIIARDKLEQKDDGSINEKILDMFIKDQEDLAMVGSGDDEVYSNQISKYINKQRKLWLTLIEQLNRRNNI